MSNSARETAIKSFEDFRLTRHVGRPTRAKVNASRAELAGKYAKHKTTYDAFPMGPWFGFSAAIIKSQPFVRIHNEACEDIDGVEPLDAVWEFAHPDRPEIYDTGITAAMSDATRRKREARRTEWLAEHDIFGGFEDASKDKLIEAYDEAYFSAIKHPIFGLSNVTVNEMLNHLESQCLALTSRDKEDKLSEMKQKWNQDDDITIFFNNLEQSEEELNDDYEIEYPIHLKILHAIKEMKDSNVFTEEQIMDWEDKEEEDKTWVHLQNYFGKLWKRRQRYAGSNARKHGYESAAAATEAAAASASEAASEAQDRLATNLREMAVAATADKEHIQQMSDHHNDMLKLVQQQQATIEKQASSIEKLTAQNSDLIKIVGKHRAKPPAANAAATGAGAAAAAKAANDGERRVPPKCGVCGARHPTKSCWELEANADKRPPNWKSRFA